MDGRTLYHCILNWINLIILSKIASLILNVSQNEYELTKKHEYELTKMRTNWPKNMSASWPKWGRIDQNEYELTKQWVRIDQMSTNWPNRWVRIDQNENDLSTSWLEYELTGNFYTCMYGDDVCYTIYIPNPTKPTIGYRLTYPTLPPRPSWLLFNSIAE